LSVDDDDDDDDDDNEEEDSTHLWNVGTTRRQIWKKVIFKNYETKLSLERTFWWR
jgi:pterin-4a-carbinolamine dehydratase